MKKEDRAFKIATACIFIFVSIAIVISGIFAAINSHKIGKLENHLIEVEVIGKDYDLFTEVRHVKTKDGQRPWIKDSFSEVGDKFKIPIKKLNNYVIPHELKVLYGLAEPQTNEDDFLINLDQER